MREEVPSYLSSRLREEGPCARPAVLPFAGGSFLRPTEEGGGRRERSRELGAQVPLVGTPHPPRLLRRRYSLRRRREGCN
ncbi:hypothetical protein BH23ACT4_BH23ACT4_03920 [soil metagenome]